MTTKNLIFVDGRVANYDAVVSDLGPDTEWYLLNPNKDGILQIQGILSGYTGLSAIHIVSHGSSGAVTLGSTTLNQGNLTIYNDQLKIISTSLDPDGDVFLYGCNVAEGEDGATFITALAKAIGADVAASTDTTGIQGNWILEASAGTIEQTSLHPVGYTENLAIISGTTASDQLRGTDDNDLLSGGAGNDVLTGLGGNDIIEGGTGVDTAAYSQPIADYRLARNSSGEIIITDTNLRNGNEGTDIFRDIERLEFADGRFALGVYQETLIANQNYSSAFSPTPAVAGLANGGYVVTWGGFDGNGIYAQRFHADGRDVGGIIQVAGARDSRPAEITALSDGGYVVAWTSSDSDIYTQRYNSTDSPTGQYLRANTITQNSQTKPEITGLNDGGYIVSWWSQAADNGIYLQRYLANGTPVGSETKVNFSKKSADGNHAIAALADGGYIVTWNTGNTAGNENQIYAQRYDANGSRVGEEQKISATPPYTFAIPAIAGLSDGGYMVTWSSNIGGWAIYGQRYDDTGAAVGGNIRLSNVVQSVGSNNILASLSDVVGLPDGGYVVTWDFQRTNINMGEGDIYSQRYDFSGNRVGQIQIVNSTIEYEQRKPAVAALADGGYIFTWYSAGSLYSNTAGIVGQRYDASGNTVYTFPLPPNQSPTGNVTIIGAAAQGQTLIASNTLSDADGLGTISYQWKANGEIINGATGSQLTLNQTQVGKTITVTAYYTDGQGTEESVTSDATTPVMAVATNAAPTGNVRINGTTALGQTLTATHTLADADGLGIITYQWQANGVEINGATGNTLTLTSEQIGKTITVTASYTDGNGTLERVASAATAVVSNSAATTGGKVTTDFGSNSDYGHSIAIQADGKFLVAGSSGSDFALARYTANGILDRSFGNNGLLVTDFNSGQDEAWAVTLQSDGKILVLGSTEKNNGNSDFAFARYNSNGSLDSSFDIDGKLTACWFWTNDQSSDFQDYGSGVIVQPDGKILAVGYSNPGTISNFALDRYYIDGSNDFSFNDELNDLGGVDSFGEDIALQADGKILVAGSRNGDFALARYHADGNLDTSFSGDGWVATDFTDNYVSTTDAAASLVVQPDGRILVVGVSENNSGYKQVALVRYHVDGSLDRSFSTDGLTTTGWRSAGENSNPIDAYGFSVALQADGKILVAGTNVNSSGDGNFILMRYHSDGKLDTTFSGGDGGVATGFGSNHDIGYDVAIQADGKILVIGSSKNSSTGNSDFAIARYNPDGSLDTTFGNEAAPNSNPVGRVIINGIATQGQTLTASNTLSDADGLGTISYQWKANGSTISGATGPSLTLTQAQVGQSITVTASYTDGQGTLESVTSASTAAIANINDAPNGSVTINGSATQGRTLTASNTLTDADGLGSISYQWKANGSTISGATGPSLTLAQAQVGQSITVTANYTDGQGTRESITSAATAAIANVNDAPNGSVTISGTAAQGETLRASHTLTDADGLGSISYQWKANGSAISGATDASYTLTQTEVGKTMTVTASYTDGGGTMEAVTSSATTAAIGNLDGILNTFGITRQQAGDWVVQHLHSPQDIYSVSFNSGITSNMLAEVVQPFLPDIVVTGMVVNDWLQANGQPALI